VIVDLGVAKTVSYDATRNASVLSRTWLAKASASQRAGRTGRVRAGTVYRLYTQNLFEALPAHDVSGICDQPLEATVLQLRGMLTNDQSVSSLLDEAIEPPELAAVGGALIRLAALGFLQLPHGDHQAGAAAAYKELHAALATKRHQPRLRRKTRLVLLLAPPLDGARRREQQLGEGLGVQLGRLLGFVWFFMVFAFLFFYLGFNRIILCIFGFYMN
jgi:HrpA-like RNA helicase